MQATKASKIFQELGSYVWDLDEKINSEGTWSMASCPLAPWTHGSGGSGRDMNPSFAVNVEPGASVCKCYSCDFVGPISAVVEKVYKFGGISEEVRDSLIKFIGVEEKRGFEVIEDEYIPMLPSFLTEYFYRSHPYILERGLDDDDIATWGLGYSDDVERVLFPFYDDLGTLVGVIGRDVTGEHPLKYMIYPSGFPKSRYLFGENKLTGEEEAVLVVEGYLDAVMARKHLPNNIGVVALGTAIPSTTQLRRLLALAPEIVLGLDNPEIDNAGEKGYEKCKKFLLGRCKLSELDYRQFKDAGEAGDKIALIVEHRTKDILLNPLRTMLAEMKERLTKEQGRDIISTIPNGENLTYE